MKKSGLALLGAVSIISLAFVSLGTPSPVQADHNKTAEGSTAQAMAQMAERLFPSGTQSVVLCSGSQARDIALGQALAARMSGALLLTQNAHVLGNATAQALQVLAIPQVAAKGVVQPYQPPAQKPRIYVMGSTKQVGNSIVTDLQAQGYTVQRVGGQGASLIKSVLNRVAPPLPQASGSPGFPSNWTVYAGEPSHNAAFAVPSSAPKWEQTGVKWNFAENAAVPLNSPFPDLANLGLRGAPVKMTQNLGNAVGVSAVNGVIYAESDDYHLYALNAKTGRLLWKSGMLVNNLMGNPIVANNLVYVTAGDTGFPFSQVLHYEMSNGTATLTRGLMYSAIYAFNARTGRLVWRQDFHGNAMPTPVYNNKTVYEATGGGNLWAFNAATGAVKWKTSLQGFDSMSSPNVYTNPVTHQTEIIVGTSDQNHVVAVNAANGSILWSQKTALNIFNTGMGDNSPTVDQSRNIVIQDSVVNFDKTTKTTNLAVYAMNATTGQVLWSQDLGVGNSPPAYKAGVSMVHNGIVYVGSPVTSTLYALNERNGSILWKFSFQNAGPAGAGRGNAVYAYGVLWVAAGPKVYALNPQTGQELGSYSPGGRFGIVNPVIVGATMYLDNSYDWVQAIPLKTIDPHVAINVPS
ncbi:MAG: PQQ-binding-like beta-propeller repeat protein [Firmicutes bacterium]|uniref:Pyrrolo-quinoline quinone repeat domain-containing protein n=1 Tax=Sulfobacillus benefaciens TaxID=453960 RepID=A0A2T2X8X7_9FIRM|nr:PQQ-binding-like beta-propeller repeat protein [Bacillota bacterium]MCL5014310.1 PQQ-binding-like beta-propeller repeat protein [Bacillota bacterium]PSR30907.1 MAG: hypothetical protein C7B43_04440 [Sulfobacillus benefaciens]